MNKRNIINSIFILFVLVSQSSAQSKRDFDIRLSKSKTSSYVLACKVPEFSFHLPQMAGNFRIGISNGTESLWGDELKEVSVKQQKNKIIYTLKDSLLAKGQIRIAAAALSDSEGVVIEIISGNVPDNLQLIWSFGGCYGKILDNKIDSHMNPEYCKYNVFSVERTSFTAYYGESMNLKVFMGITPLESDIRLADAHQQKVPLFYFHSGKQTDAPALAAVCPLANDQKLYFCFYTQNDKADYNYFMLPELFKKEFEK